MCYVVVGIFHPPNVLSSVTTTQWAIVHVLATAMCFFGILGMVGLYTRQAEKSGWLGRAGFVLLSLWFALILGFSFVETFILPQLAIEAPTFVDGFLGVLTSTASEMNLGALPTLWTLTAPLYMLGGLLFGIATFRAGILPRWAGALLVVGPQWPPWPHCFRSSTSRKWRCRWGSLWPGWAMRSGRSGARRLRNPFLVRQALSSVAP